MVGYELDEAFTTTILCSEDLELMVLQCFQASFCSPKCDFSSKFLHKQTLVVKALTLYESGGRNAFLITVGFYLCLFGFNFETFRNFTICSLLLNNVTLSS